MLAQSTSLATAFGTPQTVAVTFADNAMYPEYPRAAGTELHYSIRELDMRRSIYATAPNGGPSSVEVFDAGDIFTYAVSSNDLVMYVTFQLDNLEVYRAERPNASAAFSMPVRDDVLSTPTALGPFAVTGVTDDDCEVFGSVLELTGDTHIWHARRE